MHELVIRDATIVNGSGSPCFRGRIRIDSDLIRAGGEVSGSGWRTLESAEDGQQAGRLSGRPVQSRPR